MALGFNMHDLSVLSYPEKNSFNISSQIKTHMPRNTLEMLVFFFFPFPAHLNRIDLHYTKWVLPSATLETLRTNNWY